MEKHYQRLCFLNLFATQNTTISPFLAQGVIPPDVFLLLPSHHLQMPEHLPLHSPLALLTF